jgi:hypothetical protein
MDELRDDLPPRFATALDYDFPADRAARVTLLASAEPASRGLRALRADLLRLGRVLRAARTHPALLLESKGGWLYPDVVAAAVLGLLAPRHRPKAVLMGEMWEPDGGLAGWLERRLLRLADRAIDLYAVQSSEELAAFPRLWGIDPDKLRLNPYFYHFDDVEQLAAATTDGGFVFAGGDSLRSYDALVEAARRVPQLPVKARTRLLDGRDDLPANVEAGRVAPARFFDEMRAARAVVVPLKPGLSRAAGQQTFLNAMFLGKPTIVADGFGVRDHITDGVDGWIADGSVDGYAAALRWVADDAAAAARARLGAAARATARRFHFDAHAGRLVDLVAECLRADARAGAPASPGARPARG